jgi:indolepyruvate ferredoxin oxidoreductase, alpha subunit
MHPLVSAENEKLLLLGNEAIVRGALEAGVGFMSTYPGTPSSEIGDTFFKAHKDAGVTFEYSTNEKVALEVAAAAAAAGVRTLVAMKHVGVNVAADPLMTLAYVGVQAGLVLVSADDPGCHSSQNEQDNRHFARLGKIPMLEPSTPAEAYELVKEAFALSEKYETPVILRTTTRVSHTRGVVSVGQLGPRRARGQFAPDKRRFMPVPAIAKLRHPVVEEMMGKVAEEFEDSPLNRQWGSGALGILASGVAACYVEDMVKRFDLQNKVRVFDLATTHPVPRRKLAEFLGAVDRALVVEELDPILENELRAASTRARKLIPIFGKESGHFSLLGELTPDLVAAALSDLLSLNFKDEGAVPMAALPGRPPILCPACPHRSTYYDVKLAMGDEPLYISDIGCYTLGFLPPIGMGEYFICMGSSISGGGGFSAVSDRPVVSFIGDSTFFHSGITGLINSVHNKRDLMLVILDNSTTGMTGHQPHSGSEIGDMTPVDIEGIVRAAGVSHIAVIDPFNAKESLKVIDDLKVKTGVKVLISRSPCPLYARKTLKIKRTAQKYTIDQDKCRLCGREGFGTQCGLPPIKEYALARGLARVIAGPNDAKDYNQNAPKKMEHPPCESACPLGLCVQGYVQAVAAGCVERARQLIRQRLIMPHVVCRLCPAPCEQACIRAGHDEAVAINDLKRFVMDRETDEMRAEYIADLKSMILPNDKKVAVVGAGPSGLSCAFDLRVRGYEVTVFEAEDAPGGMLRFGVPRFRLPREALEKDLAVIQGIGVDIQCGQCFGRDFDMDTLKNEGFAALYLAPGMTGSAPLNIEGEDLPQVADALEFLHHVNVEGDAKISGDVIVVGGGNSAVDAARSALRLGASQVTILYRRTREQMPALAQEIDEAVAEGVEIVQLAAPEKITANGGRLAVSCRKMILGEPDKSGRAQPVPTEEFFVVHCDHLIKAIGQSSELTADKLDRAAVDKNGRIMAETSSGATDDPFVFSGGDAVTGPATVVDALQFGKYAAYGIDRALADDPKLVVVEAWKDTENLLAEEPYQVIDVPPDERRKPPVLDAKTSAKGFDEVRSVFSEKDAIAEARRCLACGMCAVCENCLTNFGCPAFYVDKEKIYIDPFLCDGCGACVQVCPNGAITQAEDLEVLR